MKKFMFKTFSYTVLAIGLAAIVGSCKKTETVPMPVPDFTFTVDGTTVTFTNTSTDGVSYLWDFGDGQTSTDASPTHDYGKYAAFIVDLTATNATGSETKSVAVQVVAEITIDGDMADWANIPAASTKNSTNTGILTTVKVVSDLTNVYFYMEGDASINGFIQLYINADGDPSTGWATDLDAITGLPIHPVSGADFELDADAGFAELWRWEEDAINNPDRYGWNFNILASDNINMYIAPVKTGNAVEFALVRANFPGGLADVFSFALGDVDVSIDWNEHGYLPNPGEDYIEHELFK